MSQDQLEVGEAQACYNVSNTRILKYSCEMYHKGLNEHKVISAPELGMLENKVNLQAKKWAEKWGIIESRRKEIEEKEANADAANSKTKEVIDALKEIDNILIHTLSIDDTVNWDSLKKKDNYPEKIPSKPNPKTKQEYPPEPKKELPVFTFIEKLIKSKKERKIQDCEASYLIEMPTQSLNIAIWF